MFIIYKMTEKKEILERQLLLINEYIFFIENIGDPTTPPPNEFFENNHILKDDYDLVLVAQFITPYALRDEIREKIQE